MSGTSMALPVPKTLALSGILAATALAAAGAYPIVDTRVPGFYGNNSVIPSPASGQAFYGQDAGYQGAASSYTDNGDGTITDNVTGLMWQRTMDPKCSFAAGFAKVDTLKLGGYSDWRLPTIKELYSLILFSGQTATGITSYHKFIDTAHFDQPLGDLTIGEREIDAQTWTATKYTGLTMVGDSTVFGVNFIDGRIKGYPLYKSGSGNKAAQTGYFRMVRGNTAYGRNDFAANGDGTVSDRATGLMWQQADDGVAKDWLAALAYCEDLSLAARSDWRLPNAKELQSLVDYTRSPSKTNSPAIDPLFATTSILDPDGVSGQYPYFWTSTTHLDGMNSYNKAVYLAFGKAQGKMNGVLLDVHGAGAQRSDPKSVGATTYPQYFGPQGDVQYVNNYARCVRDDNGGSSSIRIGSGSSLPMGIGLNHGVLSFGIRAEGDVQVRIQTLQGKTLAVYALGWLGAGSHTVSLKGLQLGAGADLVEIRTAASVECGLLLSQGR